MHAYIDMESFPDLTLDAALRVLLKNFRLPGTSWLAVICISTLSNAGRKS